MTNPRTSSFRSSIKFVHLLHCSFQFLSCHCVLQSRLFVSWHFLKCPHPPAQCNEAALSDSLSVSSQDLFANMSAANLFQNDPAMSRHKWSLEKSIKGQTQDSSNLKVRWVNRGGPMCLLGSGWYNVMKNSGNGPLHAIGGQWVF